MNKENLQKTYCKTDRYCHICHKKLSFTYYSVHSIKEIWKIEHSVAKINRDSDLLCNLFSACTDNKEEKKRIRKNNTVSGISVGSGIELGGPTGGISGSVVGDFIGNNNLLNN